MSKTMNEQELNTHCNDAVSSLQTLLTSLAKSGIEKMTKRAKLLAYWIKRYVRYIQTEDTFSPQAVFKLERGAVVSVEFGYRVGRELGGRHYAVVIDANNPLSSNTVTVVPLGSLKGTTKESRFNAILEDGLSAVVAAGSDEFKNLKVGSVAKVGQVTTISKMRIYDPRDKKHPLYGARLSERDMAKIDACLKDLYFKK